MLTRSGVESRRAGECVEGITLRREDGAMLWGRRHNIVEPSICTILSVGGDKVSITQGDDSSTAYYSILRFGAAY